MQGKNKHDEEILLVLLRNRGNASPEKRARGVKEDGASRQAVAPVVVAEVVADKHLER